jgi:hypothetical protein
MASRGSLLRRSPLQCLPTLELATLTIVKQLDKTIGKKSLNFNELESQFYNNIKQLKHLDSHDTKYHELYYENESILEIVEQLDIG